MTRATLQGVEKGKILELEYPSCNRVGVPLEYVPRKIEVVDVRSIVTNPLELWSFLERPFARRSATLIYGRDVEVPGDIRKFYWECRKGGQDAGLRLVLIDPTEPDDSPEPITDAYESTIADRRLMVSVARELIVPEGLVLAVQAVV